MQDTNARKDDAISASIGPGTITILLSIVLIIIAIIFWVSGISIVYPGPTFVAGGLAVIILIVGLIVRSEINDLSNKGSRLEAENEKLKNEVRAPDRLPRIVGLELLVERWKKFEPDEHHQEILNEHISILLSIAQLHYHTNDELHFIKYFHGTKIKGGAFLLTALPNIAPFVLKFDSLANISKEKRNYESCVQEFLGNIPGKPWDPRQRHGSIEGEDWSAIAYNFVGEGVSPDALRQLQTFGEYYLNHNNAQIEVALNGIFQAIQPWWIMRRGWPENCGRGKPQDLYDEYDRLTRKLGDMKEALNKVGETLAIDPMNIIKNLNLCDPFQWIQDVFKKKQLGNWINHRVDSIVHGDFHVGNILIEERSSEPMIWLIDFPHAHIGPTVQDIARLEADIKFNLFPAKFLADKQVFDSILIFEDKILGNRTRQSLDLSERLLSQVMRDISESVHVELDKSIEVELEKVWKALTILRQPVRNEYLSSNDARPYYLALLHTTLPVLYYRDRSPRQKLYAFISAGLLCKRLGG
jgi:hypothetical protein